VSAQALLSHIRGHWAACENGSHYRRDVTLGEDASQISSQNAARSMATLRNLILGIFELQKQTQASNSEYVPGWRRKMTASAAIKLIKQAL
jgi:predicted transposase YbfD/YdcC